MPAWRAISAAAANDHIGWPSAASRCHASAAERAGL